MLDKKKTAAVMAAVTTYIKTEEEAAVSRAAMIGQPMASAPPEAPVKLWAISGRQEIMQTRRFMQMKAFHR